jgi:DNA polymerase I-like protein with 3'-5' exonuclease and polymerase domains
MEMMLRGFRIDEMYRQAAIVDLSRDAERLRANLNAFSDAVWDKPLNANSTQQLQAFFYDRMGLPEQFVNQKGVRKLSMNREALEKLAEEGFETDLF